MKVTYKLNGVEVSREEMLKDAPPCRMVDKGKLVGNKIPPKFSDSMAVHPTQIAEAMEADRKHGVPVEYDHHGRPKYSSRRQQAAHIRAYGFFNRDGGYGD